MVVFLVGCFLILFLLAAATHPLFQHLRMRQLQIRRRTLLFIDIASLSGTSLLRLVSSCCIEPANLDGLQANVISVGTGNDLRICVTVEYNAAQYPSDETKNVLIAIVKERLAAAVTRTLVTHDAASREHEACLVWPHDFQVILARGPVTHTMDGL